MKFLLTMLLFLGLVPGAQAGWERVSADTIRFSGDINPGSYKEFLEVSKGGYKNVVLQSFGGTPLTALKIAEDISKNNVKVEIDGYCFSACANYLALAGKTLVLPCDALLGWHGSPTLESDEEIARKNEMLDYPFELTRAYQKWVGEFRARENRFYRSVKVDPALLQDSVAVPSGENIKPKVSFTLDEESGEFSVTRSATLWIPLPDTLETYGVSTSGFCRRYTREDIKTILKQRGMSAIAFSSGRK
ncbi:hypothetical protein SRABI118_03029 [Massilia sp. Bi118]|uniref:hypothetical protein n=1 Tax=Massilia sp. Bi118 TaxID=2822346 RepID=UPI001DF6A3E1|nr:hypothetical protein [Massilia sp. Bi118]CAH0253550.1 hypothetical protein SRABI118_03029 [Massilia sp. Bi118]